MGIGHWPIFFYDRSLKLKFIFPTICNRKLSMLCMTWPIVYNVTFAASKNRLAWSRIDCVCKKINLLWSASRALKYFVFHSKIGLSFVFSCQIISLTIENIVLPLRTKKELFSFLFTELKHYLYEFDVFFIDTNS